MVIIIIVVCVIVLSICCCLCCCKEDSKKEIKEEEELQEVVTSAQGGTFDIYVPKSPKLNQVFPFPYKWDGKAWVPASATEYQSLQIKQGNQKTLHLYGSENPQLHQVVTSVQGGMFELYLPKTPKLNQVYPFPYKWDGGAWVPASKADVQSCQKPTINSSRRSKELRQFNI